MEENKESITSTENQTPVVLNKKIPPYFLLAAVAVVLLGVLAFLIYSQKISFPKFFPKESPAVKEKALMTIKTKAYELAGDKGVQIYLFDKEKATEISAFQMKFTLPDGTGKDNITIKINPQLESQGWKFPIARFEDEAGVPVIKLSGARFGNSPYSIKGNLLLATVSTKDKTGLNLTLDYQDTLLYSSHAITTIPFDASSE